MNPGLLCRLGRVFLRCGIGRRKFGHAFFAALLLVAGVVPSHGQAAFPNPAQVAKDYPDEVQQYVILNLLWNVSKAANPGATAERGAYYGASEGIRQRHMVAGPESSRAFDDKMRQLSADRDFKRQVLEKYHLANLRPAQAPVQNALTQGRTNTDVSDAMIKGAFGRTLPVMLVTLVLMVLVSEVLVRKESRMNVPAPASANKPAGLPVMPEELRVVKLHLLEYSVDMVSAIALEKEVTMHTSAYTSTTGGQVYTVGNEVHSTPGQTTTSISTTQTDLIWVRTADGRETSWTFSGGEFKVRPGHLISAIIQAGGPGSGDFLMSFNHNTGQLKEFKGIPYGLRNRKAFWLSTLIGSIGCAISMGIILSIQPNTQADAVDHMLQPVVHWIMGLIPAVILSFIVVGRAQGKIGKKRHAVYREKYVPEFRQFLEQCTPVLQKFFGVASTASGTKA